MKSESIENEKIILPDGRVIFVSRSSAAAFLYAVDYNDKTHFLFVKRGPKCPDNIGKYVLPCGYLNWNETRKEAALRELFEETGITDINLNEVVRFHDNDSVTAHKQNITDYFCFKENKKIDNVFNFPKTSTANCDEGEVDEIVWFTEQDIIDHKSEIAFNHDHVVLDIFLKR